jgi:hypothetical protein
MKQDFSQMSRKDLKAYVLFHRDDLEALHALYERALLILKQYVQSTDNP